MEKKKRKWYKIGVSLTKMIHEAIKREMLSIGKLLFFCFWSTSVIAQIEVKKISQKKVELSYFNNSDSIANYFNPFISFQYNRRQRRLYLRDERSTMHSDTLIVFLNDTVISQGNMGIISLVDSSFKKSRLWTYNILEKGEVFRLKFFFLEKKVFDIIEVRYNFNQKERVAYWPIR